ncbi:sugar-transfer associated ATP-grasp domain-containing protein [Mariniflexile ostreae]|uniref:Sugar-transfer associated ATP-grasp domain-containing protein n=1 Tax=Mariniflexile ostreae TaxID=1520892 RepID=A0ABV5FDR4_9FLAO
MLSRLKNFQVFLKDKNKKPPFVIAKELIHFGYVKKDLPVDYFRKYLYRKEVLDHTSYLTKKQYYSIIESPKILIPEIAMILDNKLCFSWHAAQNQLPTPKLISYNVRHTYFYNSETYTITNHKALAAFFITVFTDTTQDALFLKPIKGIGGKGCLVLEKAKLKEQILKHGDTLLTTSYIHQEKINQHPDINVVHSNSVNTIRVNTYLDTEGKAHVLSALMRFGIGTSITDNTSAGGFFVAVNMEAGSLVGSGFQDLDKGGGVHGCHPDSKIILNGFKIPFLHETLELAKLASLKTPTRIIGWDIAIGNFGPIIVEGNTNPCLSMADIAYGGYCKHPLIKDILKEINP